MRAILARLFIFVCVTAAFLVMKLAFPKTSTSLFVFVLVAVFVGSFILGRYLFHPYGAFLNLPQMQEQGFLLSLSFQAKRAFAVEEREDEGLHYYLELVDGRVLYLNGQYLYAYEPLGPGEGDEERPRTFPCTEFTVRRHKTGGYVVDIQCGGEVIASEGTAASFSEEDYRRKSIPEDGSILEGKTFDQIKSERMKPQANS